MKHFVLLKLSFFMVLVGLPLLAQNPRLVSDLTETFQPNPLWSNPRYLTAFNGKVYMVGDHRDLGRKIFVYEGDGVSLLEEAPAGLEIMGPYDLTATGSHLFFNCYDGENRSLWAMGDSPLQPIIDPTPDHHFSGLKAVGDQLVFLKDGSNLWASDGTAQGTREILIHPNGATYPRNGLVFNGLYYFTADDGVHGRELWRSDLTQAGTVMVADIVPGTTEREFSDFFVLGDKLVFLIENGNSYDLWTTNGQPGDSQLVVPEFVKSMDHMTVMNNVLYINGSSQTVTNGLFRTDGTGPGSYVVEDFADNYSGRILRVFHVDGHWLYFDMETPEYGREIMRTDGTVGGARLFHDLNMDPTDSGAKALVGYNGKIFIADSNGNLWAADDSGFVFSNNVDSYSPKLQVAQNLLFYFRETFESGHEYWFYDGVTHRIFGDLNGGASSNPVDLSYDGEQLYFAMERQREPEVPNSIYNRRGLAQSNGTAMGTLQIEGSGSPWLAAHGDDLYYILDVLGNQDELMVRRNGGPPITLTDTPNTLAVYSAPVAHGHQLMINTSEGVLATDGTPDGTHYLIDLAHLSPGVSFNGFYYFLDGISDRLYRSDGTEGNADLVEENVTSLGPVVNNRFLVNKSDGVYRVESDGLVRIGTMSGPQTFHRSGNLVYFSSSGLTWVSDGTELGTRPLADITPPFSVSSWTNMGDRICMLNRSGLFITDGFEVTALASFPGNVHSLKTYGLTDSLMVFTVDDQLWRSGGTPESTYRIMDFSEADHITIFNGSLIFTMRHPQYGVELWISDGTIPGTRILADIQPGAMSSYPKELKVAGSELYFSAFNSETGRELWAYCQPPDVTIQTHYPRACLSGVTTEAWIPDAGPGAIYQWTLDGADLVSNNGSSIQFTPTGSGPVTIGVNVSTSGPCNASDALQLDVVTTQPAQPEPILGSTSLCAGTNGELYTVVESPEVEEYQWSVPPGAHIVSGQGASTIEVDFGNESGPVSVIPINGCGPGPARVLEVDLAATQQAVAGPYRELCGLSHILEANTPDQGKAGFWTILSGIGGQLSDPNDPDAVLTGQNHEVYHLRWTISGPLCGDSWDDTYIQFRGQPQADAGLDQAVCDDRMTLDATTPGYGTGLWEVVYAEGSYSHLDDDNPQSSFRCTIAPGEIKTFVLRWTVSTPLCGESFDEVTLVFSRGTSGNAGSNRMLSLNDTPQLQPTHRPGWVGTWEVVDGPSLDPNQLADPTDPFTTFTPLGGVGTYQLRRTFTIGACPSTTDSLILSFDLESRTPRPVLDGNGVQIPFAAYQPLNGSWAAATPDGLFLTDFTPEGTELITDRTAYGNEMASLGDRVVFTQDWGDTVWVSDGTDGGTMVLDHLSEIDHLTLHQGLVYFKARTVENGQELWRTDGTPEGTQMVKDLIPGSTNSSPYELLSTPLGLFFAAGTEENGVELWLSDGTEEGTFMVKDLNPGSDNAYPEQLVYGNGTLYFTARTADSGVELWKSDGTEAGTMMTAELSPGASSTTFKVLRVFNNQLLFTLFRDGQYEWWELDENGGGPQSIGASVFPTHLDTALVASNGIYFQGYDPDGNRVLCLTDGTAAGTRVVGGLISDLGSDSVEMNGVFYFQGNKELWQTDGTAQGTYMIRDLTFGGQSRPRSFTTRDGAVIFVSQGEEGHGFYKLVPEGGGAIAAPSLLCAGQGGYEAEVTLDTESAQVQWSVVNGTITGGQGTPRIRFTAGGDGEILLTAVVQLPEDDTRILETRIPVTAMVYNRWNKPAESRHDLFPNGSVDVADFLRIMENCGGN